MDISFNVYIDPVPWKRPRYNSRTRTFFNDPRMTSYQNTIANAARIAMNEQPPINAPISLHVDIFRNLEPTSKTFGDADNHLKAIADALNGICYTDDSLIIQATVDIFRGSPHVYIAIKGGFLHADP